MTDFLVAVNVALAVLWVEPAIQRPHDSLICQQPASPAPWAEEMNDEERLWLVGKIETQVLYGEKLIVLDRKGDWLKVAAAAQPTRRESRGYPGWIPAAQVSADQKFLDDLDNRPAVAITAPSAWLYSDAQSKTPLMQLSYQTRLPLLESRDAMAAVRLPDGGIGYISYNDLARTEEVTFSTANLIADARRFIGLRYIWGGTSSYGFDCSGFAMRLYQAQGVLLPRDADEQGLQGMPVDETALAPGDLLFFASEKGQGAIHHVGVYSGNGMMIHAPNSRSAITEERYNAGPYGEEFWGARRYRPSFAILPRNTK